MEFTGKEGSQITLKEAMQMTKTYRDQAPFGAKMSFAIGEDKVQKILAQKDCKGLRVYNAINEYGDHTLVFVGIDHVGQDLFNGIIVDKVIPCPPFCRETPLNSNEITEELLAWN